MTDARPVSSTLWAALEKVAANDPLPTLVGRDLGPLSIIPSTAGALERRGFVTLEEHPGFGLEAIITDPGRHALETHARIEAARHHEPEREENGPRDADLEARG